MRKIILLSGFLLCSCCNLYSQNITALQSGRKTTIRGLSVVDNSVAWVSGMAPIGYKSAIEYITPKTLIATGTSGTDISKDGGRTWNKLSSESYNSVRKAKSGSWVLIADNNGRISELRAD
ncbi:MAG: hypothetical protein ACYCZO_08330 [Daejeonella sp.]